MSKRVFVLEGAEQRLVTVATSFFLLIKYEFFRFLNGSLFSGKLILLSLKTSILNPNVFHSSAAKECQNIHFQPLNYSQRGIFNDQPAPRGMKNGFKLWPNDAS